MSRSTQTAMMEPSTDGDDALKRITSRVRGALDAWRGEDAPRERPFLTLTYAQSIDGSIAAQRGVPTLLSGSLSMKMTHSLRGIHSGIMVGVGTVIGDNPSLNTRLVPDSNPKPIIVDTSLRCPTSIKLFTSPVCVKPVIVFVDRPDDAELQQRREVLEAHGATLLSCRGSKDEDGRVHVDLRDAFRAIKGSGIDSVMVEGGALMLTSCCRESSREHLMDLAVVTVAPTFIGGLHGVSGLQPCAAAPLRLERPQYAVLGDDLVVLGHFP